MINRFHPQTFWDLIQFEENLMQPTPPFLLPFTTTFDTLHNLRKKTSLSKSFLRLLLISSFSIYFKLFRMFMITNRQLTCSVFNLIADSFIQCQVFSVYVFHFVEEKMFNSLVFVKSQHWKHLNKVQKRKYWPFST